MLRPVLVCLTLSGVGLTTASCGMVEGDPHRFENLARQVADIRLDDAKGPSRRTAAEDGLRPARATAAAADAGRPQGLRVEVMDPHALWDARDGLNTAGLNTDGLNTGGLGNTIRAESSAVVEAAAPALARAATRAVVQQVSTRASGSVRPSETAGLRPAVARAPAASRTVIQLGAYSSEAAARSAWSRVNAGAARQTLDGLTPVFERATINGRVLTRLKVAAPTAAAAAICRAARVSDPWCARRT